MERDIKIAVIGLGYVGLPLARLFSKKYKNDRFRHEPRACGCVDGRP